MGKFKPQKGLRTMIILRGLPASAKSTWALEQMKKEPDRFVRINKDGLRRMAIGESWSANVEDLVHDISEQALHTALLHGFDAIVDNTHLTQKSVNKIHKIAVELGNVLVMEKVFPVSIKECLRRNALREGVERVPDKVIHDMASRAGIDRHGYRDFADKQKYYEPHVDAPLRTRDNSLPNAIICDLDGTLALLNGRDPYDASNCDTNDLPNEAVVECVKAMHSRGNKIIFMSGRDSKHRPQTVRFIEKYCPWLDPGYSYELHMRPEGDMRKDSIVKRELFEANVEGRYNVIFALDDRDQVVRLWRKELGIPTFQVAEGRF